MTTAKSEKISTYVQLMKLYDEAFVEAAYTLILGRPADPIGLGYYANRLRRGYSRVSVLDQLVRSVESEEGWEKIPGLQQAIDRYRASRSFAGWRLALRDPELGRTPSIRRARALENSIAESRQKLESTLAKLSLQNEVVKQMVSERVTAGHAAEGHSPVRRDSSGRREFPAPQLRSRRLDEIRAFDLPPSARAVLETLRF